MTPLAGLCGLIAVSWWVWRGQNPIKGLGLWLHPWAILDLAAGAVISLIAMLGIFMIEWLLGGIRLDGAVVDPASLLESAKYMAVGAAFEEFLSRSLQLNGFQIVLGLLLGLVLGGRRSLGERLDRGLGWAAWPAVLVGAAVFGYLHFTNPDATWFSVFGNALGGLMYGIAFLGGRNVWLPLGLHFGWNFVQGPLLGFPVSGLDQGGIVQQHPVDAVSIVTGGAYGPEAGIVGMAFRFVIIALVIGYLQSRSTGQPRLATLEFPIRSYANPPRRPA